MFDFLKPPVRAAKPKRAAAKRVRQLVVHDKVLPLTVQEHPRSTRMTLRIDPGGRALKLTVPVGLSNRDIDGFLDRQQGWLMTRLARFKPEAGLADGTMIPIRGVEHRILRTGKLRDTTRLADAEDGSPTLLVGGAPEHLKRRVRDFLKREAETDLTAAVATHTRAIGIAARSVRLKDTRSRWGSCTSERDLSFSWRIVMAPPHVLDYLAAHEVAHLKEMNHGPRFWSLCGRLCPGMERSRAWLKQHGTLLHAIDFS